MDFARRFLRLLFGERGPADIVVSRSEQGTHFRLPNQRGDRGARGSAVVIILAVGAFCIFLFINGTLSYPEQRRDYWGMSLGVAVIVAILIFAFFALRINWHYEVILTPTEICVYYLASGQRWRTARIDLAPVRQFTVLCMGAHSGLQAETIEEARLVLRESKHEVVLRLAELLAAERAFLDPQAAAVRVATETPTPGTAKDRLEPPLNSKVAVTQHDAGVTLDFPLPEDARARARRDAWGTFEIAIFCLMAALVWYAVCEMQQWPDLKGWAFAAFCFGVFGLIGASSHAWDSWRNTKEDDVMRQLAIVGNMLIRTARDHRKQIWYRQEIRAIAVEDRVQITEDHSEGGGSTVIAKTYILDLVLLLHDGDKALLTTWSNDYPLRDYRPKAELEWVATVLRQTLLSETADPASSSDPVAMPSVSSSAIRDMVERPQETRITP